MCLVAAATMKTSIVMSIAALAVGILGNPHGSPPSGLKLVERAPCYHASECTWFGAAKCEQYCREQAGQDTNVDRMEKCNLLNQKRCCCSK